MDRRNDGRFAILQPNGRGTATLACEYLGSGPPDARRPPAQSMSTAQIPESLAALPAWPSLGLYDLWRWPLGAMASPVDRAILRTAATLARRQVRAIEHWERVLPGHDPFILVANHGSRRETVYLTAALMLARGGRPVHFLADWNFRLIPGVNYLYAGTGAITVTRKDARPRWLNRLKPLFFCETPALEQARARLLAGGSVGLFPEGTVNRDPRRLLRGRFGAARLSLETGVSVLPVGIRFIGGLDGRDRADSGLPMSIHIGTPLSPPPERTEAAAGEVPIMSVRAWHGEIMDAVASLCGKTWTWSATPSNRSPAPPGVPIPTTAPRAIGPGGPPC
jgi:1-acyl-sn-glycerol-3-phosphate acyltransferase